MQSTLIEPGLADDLAMPAAVNRVAPAFAKELPSGCGMLSADDDATELVIEAPKGVLSVNWREIWRYRELLYFLTWRDVKIRYKHEPAAATVETAGNEATVRFHEPQRAVSPGQAVVVYRWDAARGAREVLGGGKIASERP